MAISTNGWTIYAPEGTTMEQIADAFENGVDLWPKVTGSKLHPYRGQSPRNWVLAHAENHIVYTTWSKQRKKEWAAEQIACECGRVIKRGNLSKHRTTALHFRCLEPCGEL